MVLPLPGDLSPQLVGQSPEEQGSLRMAVAEVQAELGEQVRGGEHHGGVRPLAGALAGAPVSQATQQIVGGYLVIVTGPDHKGQARLPDAVFIVGQQRLGDLQRLGGLALADAFFMAQLGQGPGKACVHTIPPAVPPGGPEGRYVLYSISPLLYAEKYPL